MIKIVFILGFFILFGFPQKPQEICVLSKKVQIV